MNREYVVYDLICKAVNEIVEQDGVSTNTRRDLLTELDYDVTNALVRALEECLHDLHDYDLHDNLG